MQDDPRTLPDNFNKRVEDDMSVDELCEIPSTRLMALVHADLQGIKKLQVRQQKTLDEMNDLLKAWNNAKGFITTLKVIGVVIKWVAMVGAACAAIYYWFKH